VEGERGKEGVVVGVLLLLFFSVLSVLEEDND
jgi:hypothetical protein